MKNTKKILFTLLIILILVVVLILIYIIILNSKEYYEIETEGEYTGYQLKLTVNYISTDDSTSEAYYKNYNIKEGDKLYEPSLGGIWLLNYDSLNDENNYDDFFCPRIMIEILELNENNAKLYIDEEEIDYNYNTKMNLDEKIHIGGVKRNYDVQIIKVNKWKNLK